MLASYAPPRTPHITHAGVKAEFVSPGGRFRHTHFVARRSRVVRTRAGGSSSLSSSRRAVGCRQPGGETVILLHPPLHLAGGSIGMERGCQHNVGLADG